MFEANIKHFQSYLAERGYQEGLFQRTLSEVIFENGKQTLQPTPKTNQKNLAFCNAIPLSSTKLFKTNTHETLVFKRKTTVNISSSMCKHPQFGRIYTDIQRLSEFAFFSRNKSDKKDKLSHQSLNITSSSNAIVKILCHHCSKKYNSKNLL